MRINRFVALATGLSRRAADKAVLNGLVTIDGQLAKIGQEASSSSDVRLSDKKLTLPLPELIIFHKPVGYVVSRNGQGSKTIYSLLPKELADLKPVGRLDKDSSGLLLLTNDGKLAQQLTHPKYQKTKLYSVRLSAELMLADKEKIVKGVKLSDGISQMQLRGKGITWTVTLSEGKNRQIRRTFKALGYVVISLHRTQFGPFELKDLPSGHYVQRSTSVIL